MPDAVTQPDALQTLQTIGGLLLWLIVYIILALVPFCALLYAIYYLLTPPMRRNERVRLFLDTLELGLKDGHTPEAAIVDAASSRDRALGVRFQMLASWLASGGRLGDALEQVP